MFDHLEFVVQEKHGCDCVSKMEYRLSTSVENMSFHIFPHGNVSISLLPFVCVFFFFFSIVFSAWCRIIFTAHHMFMSAFFSYCYQFSLSRWIEIKLKTKRQNFHFSICYFLVFFFSNPFSHQHCFDFVSFSLHLAIDLKNYFLLKLNENGCVKSPSMIFKTV